MASFEHFNNAGISTVFLHQQNATVSISLTFGFFWYFQKKIQLPFVYLKDNGHFHLSTMFSKLFFTFFLSTHT